MVDYLIEKQLIALIHDLFSGGSDSLTPRQSFNRNCTTNWIFFCGDSLPPLAHRPRYRNVEYDHGKNFRPERHLDRNGKLFKNEAFTPVLESVPSPGRLDEFKSLPNKPPPTLEPTIGFVSGPQTFQAVVIPCVH
uniref:Uncharacterized protein n=1 Tax=Daphnia galeata TaxID=27404 RepID=A0A8J2RGA2_9CRUS|nr:unnamed protein product [Daphnia galeata]